ncbi:MAG: ornithine cyclodeaminase [Gammaproteobacteria bacterium]|nr:ornithine cyclodeaminase [Gammaproteobacteria bacterium]NNC97913.1 ornithine cyclodeaminase [Gammaproteobacteria bacterium]NNM13565.1 ornithine cyclodeaminase [Gammaproteobacteria bacterium]
MTRFIDVACLSSYLQENGIQDFTRRLVSYLEQDFSNWQDFDKSPRSAAHSDVGVIELMPVANNDLYSFKYVNGHPDNAELGYLTVMAFGVLAEVQTGYPILLSELTIATALRTAATSVMAAKSLARADSKVMALIGNGCQSEFQALAFHDLMGIEEIRCFDTDPFATAKFIENMQAYPSLKLTRCASTAEAVKGSDIVTTVTADKRYATILTNDMVEPGMHINGIGGDCPGKTEIAKDVLLRSNIFVEYEPQSRIEGDIQQLDLEHEVTEFWNVLAGNSEGRTSANEITFFDSVGFALEDYSTLRLINDIAHEENLGTEIEIVPTLENPKDLFTLTSPKGKARLRKVA